MSTIKNAILENLFFIEYIVDCKKSITIFIAFWYLFIFYDLIFEACFLAFIRSTESVPNRYKFRDFGCAQTGAQVEILIIRNICIWWCYLWICGIWCECVRARFYLIVADTFKQCPPYFEIFFSIMSSWQTFRSNTAHEWS